MKAMVLIFRYSSQIKSSKSTPAFPIYHPPQLTDSKQGNTLHPRGVVLYRQQHQLR